jgi:hypothetical protein
MASGVGLGTSVGTSGGTSVGTSVGVAAGFSVGATVGLDFSVGFRVGEDMGVSTWADWDMVVEVSSAEGSALLQPVSKHKIKIIMYRKDISRDLIIKYCLLDLGVHPKCR